MRQVTGRTNRPIATKKVSIQLALDGHSFSMPTPADGEAVEEVELLTEQTMLVPRELYAGSEAVALFAANGYTVAEESSVVVCEAPERPDVVALVAVPRRLLDAATAQWGEVRYTTPLLATPTVTVPTIALCDVGTLIYIKVYDVQLRLAEVVAVADETAVEYLLQRMAELFDLTRFTVQLEQRVADKGRWRLYKQTFKKLVCA